ncbi:MAG: carboxypeptidase M32 [Verrucomicrobia bacterium]|nr:carboxypeptidase M32 [Verrucomicrobiota bacterium]
MAKTHPAFVELAEYSKKIQNYESILALLHWDQETHMPQGGIAPRSQQVSLLSGHIHDERTGRKFKAHLEKLIHLSTGKHKVKGLTKQQGVCLREWWKKYMKDTKLPTSFVEEITLVTSEATQIWAVAKKENNFKLFAPFLQKILDLNRKKADILGFSEHPYDPLLENHEPCMTTQKVGVIFDGLKKELTALLKKIVKAKQIDDGFLHKKVSEEKQFEIGKMFLSKLPADPSYSRLDLSSHPFSMSIHPHDSRITTRIIPNAFMSNIFSVLHEGGHMMYEMGLPVEFWGTPLAEAVSLSIHESQSRWWETLIGRNLPFWKHFYPLLQKSYSGLKGVPLERFYRAINKVSPSCIRVEADEVTYCLHVILRFEVEKQLVSGKLPVSDLPEFWNEKMRELLGVTPPTDAQGCLQDIHWALGEFGYFPTYALGNIFAAHFFSAFAKQIPDWDKKISKGDLSFIRDWLKKNIHQWGRTYTSEELAKRVTGKPLSEDAYCTYLKKKYSAIYDL